jgi:hypothetical protein
MLIEQAFSLTVDEAVRVIAIPPVWPIIGPAPTPLGITTGCVRFLLKGDVMAIGSPGADSSNLVTRLIDGKLMVDVAAELFGRMPVLWGRYFTSVATSAPVEYRARRENQPLRDRNIRVLPIARQTKRVDGTQADGSVMPSSTSRTLSRHSVRAICRARGFGITARWRGTGREEYEKANMHGMWQNVCAAEQGEQMLL